VRAGDPDFSLWVGVALAAATFFRNTIRNAPHEKVDANACIAAHVRFASVPGATRPTTFGRTCPSGRWWAMLSPAKRREMKTMWIRGADAPIVAVEDLLRGALEERGLVSLVFEYAVPTVQSIQHWFLLKPPPRKRPPPSTLYWNINP